LQDKGLLGLAAVQFFCRQGAKVLFSNNLVASVLVLSPQNIEITALTVKLLKTKT